MAVVPMPHCTDGGRDIALGNSREPLVCHLLWQFFALDRIHWASDTHAKAAPLQALGNHTLVLHSRIFEDSLPDVASRSFRRWGEVGRTTAGTRTITIAPQNKSTNVGYNEGGPAITRFPFQRPSFARKSLMMPPAA